MVFILEYIEDFESKYRPICFLLAKYFLFDPLHSKGKEKMHPLPPRFQNFLSGETHTFWFADDISYELSGEIFICTYSSKNLKTGKIFFFALEFVSVLFFPLDFIAFSSHFSRINIIASAALPVITLFIKSLSCFGNL